MTIQKNQQNPWRNFHGPNLGYVMEQYELYVNDADTVNPELKELFVSWGPPIFVEENQFQHSVESSSPVPNDLAGTKKIIKTVKLLDDIRSYGHLAARINPLENNENDDPILSPEQYGLSEDDLKAIPVELVWTDVPKGIHNALDAVNKLKNVYTGSLAYEFGHVHNMEERTWLTTMVENGSLIRERSKEERKSLLKRLADVEGFEQFLHKTFVGQKRFSIEGVDMLVPMLENAVREGAADGVRNVMIGMAHRGRLSVLAHVLEKPYHKIFSEFQHSSAKPQGPSGDLLDISEGWTGDVKYHLGRDRFMKGSGAVRTRITLANNPSHLEFVDPVVEGFARAAQEERHHTGYPRQDTSKAFAILVHGDAAFPGQGIVAETLNLGGLRGYRTGGTIHIIANNMVGFTTDSHDSRFTRYASDLAKGYEIPVVHVNADDPEACLEAIYLAYQYRVRFKKDFLIDLVGYRRFGHNEMDDPAVTQPQVYKKVTKHPTVRELYADQLKANGTLNQEEIQQIYSSVQDTLQAEYEKASEKKQEEPLAEVMVPGVIAKGIPSIATKVHIDTLRELNKDLLKWPDGFYVYPKLKRILERRENALEQNGKVEWALAEALAFAAMLKEGTPIRLTGQDSERGTFAQRHIVLHDSSTNETFSPLHRIPQARASFAVHNSPLSEAGVIGFEYGYNVFAPETLVIWEGQYGDFANTAQPYFDQFISAGRAKWGQKSGLVLLLPHGYEGQGPEHSSARKERFLQLAAENNWTIANVTSSAQYFHILRRQAAILGSEFVRPLVIMTPKSLLRHPLTASVGTELSEGHFQMVVEQPQLGTKVNKVKRLVLTTGKMAIDLAAHIEATKEARSLDEIHIIRIEQLYPFPKDEVKAILQRYPHLEEMVWVQEEPKNMGSWHYIAPILFELASGSLKVGYIGRPDRSSPAGGDPLVHKKEQERIVHQTLKIDSLVDTDKQGVWLL
ncbi:2-oxoglutarate dehydrogenase E1 component [Metabacillus sediminilitoris]|uniref:2-oxoglutarate dehydrogenase E1 component n=1 Tax=Metabacillus sediminilitoris TaxID=2567941 RepID=A0A4S4BUS7_9BACI|nr:2-oxoglutarate dehydrogenase E1 component [Metabacillus sediminilitoris]QGQ44796.1 2-oxoglutarate dehydrogenase E1 component [Metabacillus sediminilitoris]THF78856.1 2-oxoglutarate dehydrogenase E1 component [Metabacillus sediminilitoris]